MPLLSKRLSTMKISASTSMTNKAREIKRSGGEVISLSSGEPDFPTPENAIEAAHRAAVAGDTKYPPHAGTAELKEAIQRKFKRENNLDYALDEIMVGNGGKHVIFNALMASLDAGDEVIIPRPCWMNYMECVRLLGGVPVPVACDPASGFTLKASDLESAITDRTKWVVLNFPNNPTGATCSREEMVAIAEVLLRHPGIYILTDDMYEHLLYNDTKFWTIAEIEPRLKPRVLTVNGVSKSYAMTGWRVGYCGGMKELIKAMVIVQGQSTSGVSTISQAAAVAVLDGPQEILAERRAIYKQRRDLVVDMLNEAEGVRCARPNGAFYVFPNIEGCLGKKSASGRVIETDSDFVSALLEEKYLAAVQGSAYGVPGYFRISYATSTDLLREACVRIREFCRNLQ